MESYILPVPWAPSQRVLLRNYTSLITEPNAPAGVASSNWLEHVRVTEKKQVSKSVNLLINN